MPGTTNRIEFEQAADLLSAGRVCVAYVVDGSPRLEPAIVRFEDPRFLIGVDDRSALSSAVDEVSFVIDEGVLFFDLRAMSVRGAPHPVEHPTGDGVRWFEVLPAMVTCWDYGQLRFDDGHD